MNELAAASGAFCLLLAQATPLRAAARPERIPPEEAESLVREISAKVEQLRGLKFKTPVSMRIVDGASARESFKAKISPWEEQDLRHTQDAYVHLGLVPRGTDMLERFLDLAETGVAGYYEHGTKTFHLLDHVSADEVRAVMAHELTHALEDQHYDLGALAKDASGDGDRAVALSAVIEGSATVVMLAFLSREVGEKKAMEEVEKTESRRAQQLRVAPSFTQRSLMLPYVLGFTFLHRGKPWAWVTEGGVRIDDLARAYANPPRATRHILHPEQYWGRPSSAQEARLSLPDLSPVLGPGWKKATEGAIGELGLAVLTGSREAIDLPWALLPSRWTNAAAAGTAGDVYQHYVDGERTVTLLLTRWETERDAGEFEEVLVRRGTRFFRYGVNFLVLAGDVGDRAEALAAAAFQGARYHPDQ